jgi:hypothetical protein
MRKKIASEAITNDGQRVQNARSCPGVISNPLTSMLALRISELELWSLRSM